MKLDFETETETSLRIKLILKNMDARPLIMHGLRTATSEG